MRSSVHVLGLLLAFVAWSCVDADSVELGGQCKQQQECKAPADTCMTLGSEMLCTVACSAEAACPSGYACAKMEVRVEGDDGGGKGGERGYCLAESRVGAHVVTIAPKGEGKKSEDEKSEDEKGKGKAKKKAEGD